MSDEIRQMTAHELVDCAIRQLDAAPGLDGSPEHHLLASIAYSLTAIAKATADDSHWRSLT